MIQWKPIFVGWYIPTLLSIAVNLETVIGQACTEDFKAHRIGTAEEVAVCAKEFTTEDCQEFAKQHDRSSLPSGTGLDTSDKALSIEKPSNLQLDPFESSYTNKKGIKLVFPGMKIIWESPASGAARKDLSGFLLTYNVEEAKVNDGKGNGCRLIVLDKAKMSFGETYPQLKFSYNLQYVKSQATIRVKAFSYPTPRQPGTSGMFVDSIVKTPAVYAWASHPYQWRPSVSVKALPNGSLDLGVSLSPERFKLDTFHLRLFKQSLGVGEAFKTELWTTGVATDDKKSAHYVFHGLKTDAYKIIVKAHEQFKDDPDKCLCHRTDDIQGNVCMINCYSVDTGFINVTGYKVESSLNGGNSNSHVTAIVLSVTVVVALAFIAA